MAKIHIRSRFATNSKSISYKTVQEKVPNWTSKGRLLEAQRACIGFELHENSLQTSSNKGISCL